MHLVFRLHVCLCNMCVGGQKRTSEPLEVQGSCEPPHRYWEANSGPEQQVLLPLSCLASPQPGILVWI